MKRLNSPRRHLMEIGLAVFILTLGVGWLVFALATFGTGWKVARADAPVVGFTATQTLFTIMAGLAVDNIASVTISTAGSPHAITMPCMHITASCGDVTLRFYDGATPRTDATVVGITETDVAIPSPIALNPDESKVLSMQANVPAGTPGPCTVTVVVPTIHTNASTVAHGAFNVPSAANVTVATFDVSSGGSSHREDSNDQSGQDDNTAPVTSPDGKTIASQGVKVALYSDPEVNEKRGDSAEMTWSAAAGSKPVQIKDISLKVVGGASEVLDSGIKVYPGGGFDPVGAADTDNDGKVNFDPPIIVYAGSPTSTPIKVVTVLGQAGMVKVALVLSGLIGVGNAAKDWEGSGPVVTINVTEPETVMGTSTPGEAGSTPKLTPVTPEGTPVASEGAICDSGNTQSAYGHNPDWLRLREQAEATKVHLSELEFRLRLGLQNRDEETTQRDQEELVALQRDLASLQNELLDRFGGLEQRESSAAAPAVAAIIGLDKAIKAYNVSQSAGVRLQSAWLMPAAVGGVRLLSDVSTLTDEEAALRQAMAGLLKSLDDLISKLPQPRNGPEKACQVADLYDETLASASPFQDMTNQVDWAGHWRYVTVVEATGLMKGYGDDKFGPRDSFTKTQALLVLSRALVAKVDLAAPWQGSMATWAKAYFAGKIAWVDALDEESYDTAITRREFFQLFVQGLAPKWVADAERANWPKADWSDEFRAVYEQGEKWAPHLLALRERGIIEQALPEQKISRADASKTIVRLLKELCLQNMPVAQVKQLNSGEIEMRFSWPDGQAAATTQIIFPGEGKLRQSLPAGMSCQQDPDSNIIAFDPNYPYPILLWDCSKEVLEEHGGACVLTAVSMEDVLAELDEYFNGNWNWTVASFTRDGQLVHIQPEITIDRDGKMSVTLKQVVYMESN